MPIKSRMQQQPLLHLSSEHKLKGVLPAGWISRLVQSPWTVLYNKVYPKIRLALQWRNKLASMVRSRKRIRIHQQRRYSGRRILGSTSSRLFLSGDSTLPFTYPSWFYLHTVSTLRNNKRNKTLLLLLSLDSYILLLLQALSVLNRI